MLKHYSFSFFFKHTVIYLFQNYSTMKKRILLLSMLFAILSLCNQPTATADISSFPDTDFSDLDGNTHNLRDYLNEGKIVIMAFWIVSESSCIAKLPVLEEVWQTHGPNGTNTTMVLGIEGAVETVDAAVQAIRNGGSATYPLINTVAGCSDKPNCGNPHYYVVCPDGGGSWSYVNQDLNGETLMAHIDGLIGGCEVFEKDASVLDLKSFDNVICEDVVQPTFTLYNRGSETLTSVDIEVSLNGTLSETFNWTGSLAQYDTEIVNLTPFDAPAETGVYELELKAVNPNGSADQNAVNDSKIADMVVIAPELRDELALYISPDFYPEEVQWELVNQDGIILGHGEGYTGDFLEYICVERGSCYEFILYDANADGFEVGHGELYQNGCEIFAFTSDDHDGLYTRFEFCLSAEFEECDEIPEDPGNTGNNNGAVGIEDVTNGNAFNLYPNPTQGQLNIAINTNLKATDVQVKIRDLAGKTYAFAAADYDNHNIKLDVSNLMDGVYFVEVSGSDWHKMKKVVVTH